MPQTHHRHRPNRRPRDPMNLRAPPEGCMYRAVFTGTPHANQVLIYFNCDITTITTPVITINGIAAINPVLLNPRLLQIQGGALPAFGHLVQWPLLTGISFGPNIVPRNSFLILVAP